MRKVDAIESCLTIYISLLLTFKDEVKELRASEVKLRETETSLRTEVDKAVRSKGELEVSEKDRCHGIP